MVTALVMGNFRGVACNDLYQDITRVIIQGIAGIMVYKQVQEWSLFYLQKIHFTLTKELS